jgi:hypothetical protein
MRRISVLIAMMAVVVGLLATPAAAHNFNVTPPSGNGGTSGWVGPFQPFLNGAIEKSGFKAFGAHGTGLNNACEATEVNDVVDIRGPLNPQLEPGVECPHGS